MFLTFPEPQTAPISGAQTSPFPADMAHPARCKQKYPSRGRFSPHSGFQLERPQNHRLQAASRLSDKLTDLISIFQRPELDFSKNKAEGDDIILSLRFRVFHRSLILTQKTTSTIPKRAWLMWFFSWVYFAAGPYSEKIIFCAKSTKVSPRGACESIRFMVYSLQHL